MSQTDRGVIASMRREIRELRERTRLIPVRWAAPDPGPRLLTISTGNTLATIGATTLYGLKYPAAAVTTVPAADPSSYTSGAAPDGLSPAYLYPPGGGSPSLVWAGYRLKPDTDPALIGLDVSVPQNTPFLALRSIQMPISGAPTTFATVWLPWNL